MTIIFTTKTTTITYTNQSLTQVGSTYSILSFLLVMAGEQKFSTIYSSNSGIFDFLPDECLGEIFNFISRNEVWLTISVVCNRWRKVGLNNVTEFSLPPVRYSVSLGYTQRNVEIFESIGYSLSLFTNLISFSISGMKGTTVETPDILLTDGILYVIANNLSVTVRHLNIWVDSDQFTPFGLAKFNLMLPNIEVLVLSGLYIFLDSYAINRWNNAIQSFRKLKILSVSFFAVGFLPIGPESSVTPGELNLLSFTEKMLNLFETDILGCHQLYVQGCLKKSRMFENETLCDASKGFTSNMIEEESKFYNI